MPGPKNRFPGPGEAERGDIHGVVGVYFYPPPMRNGGFSFLYSVFTADERPSAVGERAFVVDECPSVGR